MVDAGLEEIEVEGNEAILTTAFEDFAKMQKTLEAKKVHVTNAEFQQFANNFMELSGENAEKIHELIDKIESDDDVQAVYHNMKEIEE